MLKFFKESIKEFDHVVWPTRAETKKYSIIVLSVILALTIVLFALGSAFTTSLFALRGAIVPTKTSTTSSTTQNPIDVSNIQVTASGTSASGVVVTPVDTTGATVSVTGATN